MPQKKQAKLQQTVNLKEEKKKAKRGIVVEGQVVDPLGVTVKVDKTLPTFDQSGVPKRQSLQTPKESKAQVKAFEDSLTKIRAEQEKSRKAAEQRGKKLGMAERVGGLVTQGAKELATGLYALPYEVLDSGIKSREISDEVFGNYGQSVRELIQAQEERRLELSSLPEDASLLEKGAVLGADVAGQLAPVVGATMLGLGPATAAGAVGGFMGLGRTGDPVEGAIDAAFAVLGTKAGMAFEKGAKQFSAIALPGDGMGDKIARQFLGRAMAAGGGALSGAAEGSLRGFSEQENITNILTNAVFDGMFFSGKMTQPEIQKYKADLGKSLEGKPITKNLFEAIGAFLDDEGGQEQFLDAAQRLANLRKFLDKSAAKHEDGEPIRLYHGTRSPQGFDSFDPTFFQMGIRGRGIYTTQSSKLAGEGYAKTKAAPLRARLRVTPEIVTKTISSFRSDKQKILNALGLNRMEPKDLQQAVNNPGTNAIAFATGVDVDTLSFKNGEQAILEAYPDHPEYATAVQDLMNHGHKFSTAWEWVRVSKKLSTDSITTTAYLADLRDYFISHPELTRALGLKPLGASKKDAVLHIPSVVVPELRDRLEATIHDALRELRDRQLPDAETPHVVPLYMDIKNPLRLDVHMFADEEPDILQRAAVDILTKIEYALSKDGREPISGSKGDIGEYTNSEAYDFSNPDTFEMDLWEAIGELSRDYNFYDITNVLQKAGYDGVVHLGGAGRDEETLITKNHQEALNHQRNTGGRLTKEILPYEPPTHKFQKYKDNIYNFASGGLRKTRNTLVYRLMDEGGLKSASTNNQAEEILTKALKDVEQVVAGMREIHRNGGHLITEIAPVPRNATSLIIRKLGQEPGYSLAWEANGATIQTDYSNDWGHFILRSVEDVRRYLNSAFTPEDAKVMFDQIFVNPNPDPNNLAPNYKLKTDPESTGSSKTSIAQLGTIVPSATRVKGDNVEFAAKKWKEHLKADPDDPAYEDNLNALYIASREEETARQAKLHWEQTTEDPGQDASESYVVRGHRVWIAFKPEQVKSAIGNRGAYNTETPDLIAQISREVLDQYPTFNSKPNTDATAEQINKVAATLGFEDVHTWEQFYTRIQGMPAMDWMRVSQDMQEGVWLEIAKEDASRRAKERGKDINALRNTEGWSGQVPANAGWKDIVDNFRATVKTYTKGSVIYLNDYAMLLSRAVEVLKDTLVPTPADIERIWPGLAEPTGQFMSLQGAANRINVIDEMTFAPGMEEVRGVMTKLRDALEEAAKQAIAARQPGFTLVSVWSGGQRSLKDIKTTRRHEDIHGWQAKIHTAFRDIIDEDWDNPLFIRARNKLLHGDRPGSYTGYYGYLKNKHQSLSDIEVMAFLGSGDYKELGLSRAEAGQLMGQMLNHLAKIHGEASLRTLVLSPEMKGLSDAYRREVAKRRAQKNTESAQSTGEGGGRVPRNLWSGRGPDGGGGDYSPPSLKSGDGGDFQNVDTNFKPPTWRERLKNTFKGSSLAFDFTWTDSIKAELLDSMHPLMKTWSFLTEGRHISPSRDAKMLMRNWLGVGPKINRVFERGMIDSNDNIVTPGGLNWLFQPWEGRTAKEIEEESAAAIHLMVAERTIDLADQRYGDLDPDQPLTGVGGDEYGPGALMRDIAASKKKLREIEARDPESLGRIQEAANRYRQWARSLIDYSHAKGRITDDQHQAMIDNGDYYVDLHRLFEDSPDSMIDFGGRKYGRLRQIYKKLRGSGAEISNPYVNLMAATSMTIREADRNQALNSFVLPLRQILKELEKDSEANVEELAMYRHIGHPVQMGSKATVTVFRAGVREHWNFHPEIEAALLGMRDLPAAPLVMKLVTAPLSALRSAITHSPGFQWRNFWRDTQQRSILTTNSSKPWTALGELAKWPTRNNVRDSFFMGGAGQAGHYLSSRGDYQTELWHAIKEVSSDKNTLMAVPSQLFDFFWNKLPEAVENSNRMAEWQASFDAAKKEGLSDYDAKIKASFDARNLMDFAVSGASVKWLNKFILFLNPAIQSLRRTRSAFAEAPVPFIARWGMYALVPTLGELAWNSSQGEDSLREWQQLPAWRKDFFYNLRAGGTWITMPKPFELGVAASLTNRLVDRVYFKNEHAFEGAIGSALKSLLPVDETAIMGPFRSWIEAVSNYNWFYDEHIVPVWEEKRDPELAKSRASEIGQGIGKLINTDPRYVDHVLRGNFGDWSLMANYTGDMIKQYFEDSPEFKETRGKLVNIALGNIVRPFRPSDAVDVKAVMKTAYELYGEQSPWYKPIVEELRIFRETDDPELRKKAAVDVVLYAGEVRKFLPDAQVRARKWMKRIDAEVSKAPVLKDLDRATTYRVDKEVRSSVRLLLNKYLSAQISGDKVEAFDYQIELDTLDVQGLIRDALTEIRGEQLDKSIDRAVRPALPGTQRR